MVCIIIYQTMDQIGQTAKILKSLESITSNSDELIATLKNFLQNFIQELPFFVCLILVIVGIVHIVQSFISNIAHPGLANSLTDEEHQQLYYPSNFYATFIQWIIVITAAMAFIIYRVKTVKIDS